MRQAYHVPHLAKAGSSHLIRRHDRLVNCRGRSLNQRIESLCSGGHTDDNWHGRDTIRIAALDKLLHDRGGLAGLTSLHATVRFCSCQVRNKKKLIFFINGEPLARFPMLLLYNFVFSLLLLIIPSSSLKVIKVPSDFNMLIIIHQHIINEISDYFFIKLIQLTKLC